MNSPLLRLSALGAALTLLAACSTGPASTSDGAGDDAPADDTVGETADAPASDAYPVTVEHAFGETTIEEKPQRIATVGWADHDMVLALGEIPVGATNISWGGNGEGSTDWFDATLAELGGDPSDITRYDDTDGVPADEIAALSPDLILGTNSGLTQEDYDSLSKIAPVVAYPETAWGTPWRDSLDLVGQALGKEEQAQEIQQETEAQIEQALAEYSDLEGLSMAWTWFTATDLSTIGVYTAVDLRPQMMHEFGLVDADVVTQLTEDNPGAFSANLSAEQADTLDADLLFVYVEDDSQTQQLLDDGLVGQIPALRSGAYVATTDMPLVTAMTSPTPLSIPVVLEEFLPLVADAAENVE